MVNMEILALRHLDTCIESGEIKGDTASAIRKTFRIILKLNLRVEKLRKALAEGEENGLLWRADALQADSVLELSFQ